MLDFRVLAIRLCTSACFATSAGAAVVFDNGMPDHMTPVGLSDTDVNIALADSFNLAAPAGVQGIRFWGIYGAGSLPPPAADTFKVAFYTDNGAGLPGTLIATRTVADVAVAPTGFSNTSTTPASPEYRLDAGFAPVSLAAGTPYWVSVVHAAPPDGRIFGWLDRTTPPAPASAASFDGGSTWFPRADWVAGQQRELTFQLFDTPVPEPATGAAVLLAVTCLLTRRTSTPRPRILHHSEVATDSSS